MGASESAPSVEKGFERYGGLHMDAVRALCEQFEEGDYDFGIDRHQVQTLLGCGPAVAQHIVAAFTDRHIGPINVLNLLSGIIVLSTGTFRLA